METYIGLDAHSATCTFVTLDLKGKVLSEAEMPTTEGNLLRFVRSQKGNRKLVFEESGLSKWLHTVLKKKVDELTVCHPGYLNKRQGSKNDRNDAWHLANELRCGHVVSVFHDPSELMDLRVMVSGYNDLIAEIVRTKNRYKALFRSEALPTSGKTIFNTKSEKRIEELSNPVDQFVAQNLFSQLGHLDQVKKKYQETFSANMKKNPILKRLDSVPGIDIVRAHVIAAYLCTGHRFKNKHKLWSYAMLVKHIEQSGGKIYGKRVHHGRSELKSAFIGVAESVLKGETSLRKHYEQLRLKGLDHRAAKLSVARKVAAICLAVFKHEKPYDDHYEEKQKRLLSQKNEKK